MQNRNTSSSCGLRADSASAVLVSRICAPHLTHPAMVAVHRGELADLSTHAAALAELLVRPNAVRVARSAPRPGVGWDPS